MTPSQARDLAARIQKIGVQIERAGVRFDSANGPDIDEGRQMLVDAVEMVTETYIAALDLASREPESGDELVKELRTKEKHLDYAASLAARAAGNDFQRKDYLECDAADLLTAAVGARKSSCGRQRRRAAVHDETRRRNARATVGLR